MKGDTEFKNDVIQNRLCPEPLHEGPRKVLTKVAYFYYLRLYPAQGSVNFLLP